MSIISMTDVSLTRQGKTLLKNLNWQVESGQTWAILGLNGAGKSTLLKLIMAEFFQSQGDLKILGHHFGHGDITSLRNQIGVVSSFITERLPKHMKAEKIVLTGKYKASILYKAYGESDLQEAKDMLTSLGAGELIGRDYHSLSQGEKQIVLVARSLMEAPAIIILDEATVGLDLFAREKLLRQIDKITELDHAPLVLYVTHHAEEITEKMTHILLLREGEIVAQGKKEDIITPEVLADFYQNPVQIIPIDEHRFYINPLLS
ncbi:ABC transporter ATP-binding protein [Streptococcus saliviloxodontae]|uniref:Iron complex transport system ATP-binding protein n=1 Tax=Streptococcus saliviloxodontae TaxID=1349416 RepID=A0ABS2PKX1_9STRE|nr:ABC transporter ATP-binding protein [Streptococcus saliviloxodontae]MBM7635635.1 iron complex transport system ATP-binding protein [Streptococcus saliviloxodontae]